LRVSIAVSIDRAAVRSLVSKISKICTVSTADAGKGRKGLTGLAGGGCNPDMKKLHLDMICVFEVRGVGREGLHDQFGPVRRKQGAENIQHL
jgi:hypothetical protein